MILAISVITFFATPSLSSAIKAHGQYVPMASEGKMWYTKSGPSSSFINKRNTPSVPRQGKNYDDDTIDNGGETVDLHKGEFCVDVSTYGPIEYDHVPVEVCDSTFTKQCETKYDEVITTISQVFLSQMNAFVYSIMLSLCSYTYNT